MYYLINHISETKNLYEKIENSVLNTYEIRDELMTAKPIILTNEKPINNSNISTNNINNSNNLNSYFNTNDISIQKSPKNVYFQNFSFSISQKSTKNRPQNNSDGNLNSISLLENNPKFSFLLNKWEFKDNSMNYSSERNQSKNLIIEEIPIIIKNHGKPEDSLKILYTDNDYKSFLNMKLNGFKEYNEKKLPYLQRREKITKKEVFSYLFDQNLSKNQSMKMMQLRLKKISDVIKQKNSGDIENVKNEENNDIMKKFRGNLKKQQFLDEFFKKEEKTLNIIRQKLNKAFIYNQN